MVSTAAALNHDEGVAAYAKRELLIRDGGLAYDKRRDGVPPTAVRTA